MSWRIFLMRDNRGNVDRFYAPDLPSAFDLAWLQWPNAEYIESL